MGKILWRKTKSFPKITQRQKFVGTELWVNDLRNFSVNETVSRPDYRLRDRILCCLLINKQMAVKFNKILTFTLHFLNVQFKEANVVNL
jgi:hypothetical protein